MEEGCIGNEWVKLSAKFESYMYVWVIVQKTPWFSSKWFFSVFCEVIFVQEFVSCGTSKSKCETNNKNCFSTGARKIDFYLYDVKNDRTTAFLA